MKRFFSLLLLALTLAGSFPCFASRSESLLAGSERRYFPTPFSISDSVFDFSVERRQGVAPSQFVVDVRAAVHGISERPGLAPNYWGLSMICGRDTLTLTLRHGNSDFGDLLDRRLTILTLSRGSEILEKLEAGSGFETSSGTFNTLRLTFDAADSLLEVSGGGKSAKPLLSAPIEKLPDAVSLWSRGELDVASLASETSWPPQSLLASSWTLDRLKERFAESTDPLEGFWQYLDRENDPQYARPGGRYTLALVRNDGTETYDIIYVKGAETFASKWEPMMRKGRLLATVFENHYDLEWIDATFEPLRRDIHASVGSGGAVLSLSFPLLKTVMRFSRMPL